MDTGSFHWTSEYQTTGHHAVDWLDSVCVYAYLDNDLRTNRKYKLCDLAQKTRRQ